MMGRILRVIPTAVALGGFIFVVSCGGGGEADDSSREITSDQLSQMVLALADFGPEFSGFAPDSANGATTLEGASKDDFDPEAERVDLETFGWASGFDSFYGKDSAEDGAGSTFVVGSSVSVFETVDGASGYVRDSQIEIPEDIGKTNEGFTLTQMEEFPIEAGDEAIGARGLGTFSYDDGSTGEVWLVAVLIRRGRLTGVVSAGGFVGNEEERVRTEGTVKTLATVMSDRIGSVVSANAPAPNAAAGR